MSVVLEEDDFNELITRVSMLETENENLREANKKLNNQVKEYNEEFGYETVVIGSKQ